MTEVTDRKDALIATSKQLVARVRRAIDRSGVQIAATTCRISESEQLVVGGRLAEATAPALES